MMKLLAVLSISLFSTLLPFLKVNACSCVTMSLKQSIPLYNCIITGNFVQGEKLEEISEMNNNLAKVYYTGKFMVSKVHKGTKFKEGDTVIISSDYDNCTMLFKNDHSYLLFALIKENKLFVSRCSPSCMLDDKENLKILKQTEQLVKYISPKR